MKEKKKLDKSKIISIALPIVSVIIVIAAMYLIRPRMTGYIIMDDDSGEQLVNVDITLQTKEGEVIPPDGKVQVFIDDRKAEMSIVQFIQTSGEEYEIDDGEMPEFGFYGKGFTGDHEYSVNIDKFDIDTTIGKGEHIFITRIVYREYKLYERQYRIMI